MKVTYKFYLIVLIFTVILVGIISYFALKNVIILLLIPIILTFSTTIILFIDRFLKQIELLNKTVQDIASGDLSKRVSIHSKDEVGQLALSFNNMTEKLQEVYSGLEKKVAEKTAELAGKVEETDRQNRTLDSVIKNIPIGVSLSDLTGKSLIINDAGLALIGSTDPQDITIAQRKNFYRTDETPYPQEELPTALARQQGLLFTKDDIFVHQGEGQKIALRQTAVPVKDSQGTTIAILSIFEDITKEKEIDRMKTEFISLASHQLRTPLSAIKWFSEMLMGGDAGELTNEQKDFTKNISDSTERMIELVNSLLNISRIESGRILIDPKPTNLKDLIDSIVTELQVKVKERQQNIIVSVHSDLPKINLDPKLVRQVYMNLLTNAIKYTPKGGEISIFISKKDDQVLSQVTDNGYGIPKSQQEKIFKKFFRAENIIKVETDGTGLGLYLIKAIIESSHGKIWFDSEEGKGTTFWFSLPMEGMAAKKGEVTLDE